MSKSEFGVIGLAVMGSNLARNVERNGFSVAVYNLERETTDAFMGEFGSGRFHASYDLESLVESLERPRRILMMIRAGKPVDSVIGQLRPILEAGDILIDGGNSNFHDTKRRIDELAPSGIRFVGMGVSGGEEGALWGPSMMPGGEASVYEHLEPILTQIAAKTESGPCVTYVGSGSSGHFVKMVHNGIEYGDMQLIAEAHQLLRDVVGLDPASIAQVFEEWNEGELESFLIEITAKIANFADDQGAGGILLDHILDAAGQKGTGKWTTITALEIGVPIPTITAAVDARIVSSFKDLRRQAARIYPPASDSTPASSSSSRAGAPPALSSAQRKEAIDRIRAALYASKICSYAQGFHLIQAASEEYDYGVEPSELARIWKGGCIIRAVFLDRIMSAFRDTPNLPNLLLHPEFSGEMESRTAAWRAVVEDATRRGLPIPAMSASLAYFDALRSERLSANLIQAQRDFFGAHTYQRVDREGTFHTEWPSTRG